MAFFDSQPACTLSTAQDEGDFLKVHPAPEPLNLSQACGVNEVPGGVSGRGEGIGGVSLHIAQYLDRMIKIAQSVDQINCTVCGSNNN